MGLLNRFSWKQFFQFLGLILVWIFPVLTLLTSLAEQDLITAVFAFGVGLVSTLVIYFLIRIIDFIFPTVSKD